MSMPGTGYDEIGSRTRQAWLRTALGMVAVTALVERGLAIRGMPLGLGLATLLPVAVLVTLAARRSVALGPHHATGPSRSTLILAAAMVVVLALAATASVVAVG